MSVRGWVMAGGIWLAVVGGCYPRADLAVDEASPRLVQVVAVRREQTPRRTVLLGLTEPWRETTLYFEVSGIVEKVLVEEGATVAANQPIAQLVLGDYQAGLAKAEGERNAAQARLDLLLAGTRQEDKDSARAAHAAAVARSSFWQAELRRQQGLFRRGTATVADLEEARREQQAAEEDERFTKARLDRAIAGPRKEEIAAGRAEVAAFDQARTLAQRQLDKATIKAPFAGRVEKRLVDPGAYVNVFPMGGVPVVHLVDLSQVDAVIAVPEQLLSTLMGRQSIQVASAVDAQVVADAKVVSLSLTADRAAGTYALRRRIDNSKKQFTGAMVVTANIETTPPQPTVRIPITAIRKPYGQPAHVLLVRPDGDEVVAQPIEIGPVIDNEVEVTKGLAGGERLIVVGQHLVVPGDRVRVEGAGKDSQ